MDSLYSSVVNYKGDNIGSYLNTTAFRSVTACGINRTLKIRNDTNCHIKILIHNGEFQNIQEAKYKIQTSLYRYDNGAIIKPFSMTLLNTLTYSFYIACFVIFHDTNVMLFERLMNKSNDINITDSYLLSTLKEASINDYIKYLKSELQEKKYFDKRNFIKTTGENIVNEKKKYFKKDYLDFTRSQRNLKHNFTLG